MNTRQPDILLHALSNYYNRQALNTQNNPLKRAFEGNPTHEESPPKKKRKSVSASQIGKPYFVFFKERTSQTMSQSDIKKELTDEKMDQFIGELWKLDIDKKMEFIKYFKAIYSNKKQGEIAHRFGMDASRFRIQLRKYGNVCFKFLKYPAFSKKIHSEFIILFEETLNRKNLVSSSHYSLFNGAFDASPDTEPLINTIPTLLRTSDVASNSASSSNELSQNDVEYSAGFEELFNNNDVDNTNNNNQVINEWTPSSPLYVPIEYGIENETLFVIEIIKLK